MFLPLLERMVASGACVADPFVRVQRGRSGRPRYVHRTPIEIGGASGQVVSTNGHAGPGPIGRQRQSLRWVRFPSVDAPFSARAGWEFLASSRMLPSVRPVVLCRSGAGLYGSPRIGSKSPIACLDRTVESPGFPNPVSPTVRHTLLRPTYASTPRALLTR